MTTKRNLLAIFVALIALTMIGATLQMASPSSRRYRADSLVVAKPFKSALSPYCDVAMEIREEYRPRGLGAYLAQELKRIAYEMGGIPAARCDPNNIASRKTLQKAGLVPFAHILVGKITMP
jgi:GNAT superfamily N-acetyltransferase